MKKTIIIFTTILFVGITKAQVAIGKDEITNSSVLLEFGNEAKGIILPAVDEAPDAVDGTFILDNTIKSVRVMQNGDWTDLTKLGAAAENPFSNAGTDVGEGVIIGAESSGKPGVLVLESATQALVLPKVNEPELNVLSPVAGTIVYDTASSMLAVYDGQNWSFWK